jgi:hypothetical protein
MQGSPLPREARRRPELDLLVGPLEAAAAAGAVDPAEPERTIVELPDVDDAPTSIEQA